MRDFILKNGLKLIYKKTSSELTSICISLDAGAGKEDYKYGTAHAVEHMVYKGTKKRSEMQINKELSSIFGFQNAMTNYPYVIYYGTLLQEDFEKGIDLFSDIIINPLFEENGFQEEMSVIKEELNEWDEELEQFCEDNLFINSFTKRRIKYPIIGMHDSLDSMNLDDIREFYRKNYFPKNTSIAVISSLEPEEVKDIVEKYFADWTNDLKEKKHNIFYEKPKAGKFIKEKDAIKTCKVQLVSPIDELNEDELKCLRIFNQYFGEGVNSLLYDTLRTKNGLIYDVITKIAHENYIKLYKITFSTSKDKVDKSLKLISKCINNLENVSKSMTDEDIQMLVKGFKLKRLFREEQSIIEAKELATYDSMFDDYNIYVNEGSKLSNINKEKVFEIGIKVLKNITIQVIS